MRCFSSKRIFASKFLGDRGYTLLDALLQLSILMLCLNMILVFSPFIAKLQSYIIPENMLWERFVTILSKNIEESTTVQVDNDAQNIVYFHQNKGEENRIIFRDHIVYSTFEKAGGHVVLLTNVKTINFKVEEDKLYVQIQFLRAEQNREAIIILPNTS